MDERNELFREMKNFRFLKRTKKMNCLKLFEQTWKHYRFLLNEQIFQKICQKIPELAIFWNKVFKKNCFFLLNDWFHWKNDLIEWSFREKTNEIEGKWTIILKSSHNFKCKKTHKMSHPWRMNERNWKIRTCPFVTRTRRPTLNILCRYLIPLHSTKFSKEI